MGSYKIHRSPTAPCNMVPAYLESLIPFRGIVMVVDEGLILCERGGSSSKNDGSLCVREGGRGEGRERREGGREGEGREGREGRGEGGKRGGGGREGRREEKE